MWLKLDDQFPDHPKVGQAGGDAAWLWVCGLCYCGRYLTDGRIPKNMVARLSDRKSPGRLAARLVAVGLWVEDGDDYVIPDYLDYQPPRVEVERKRSELSAKRSEAGRRGAAKRWGKPIANEMASTMANASQTDAPVPVPVHKPPPLPSEPSNTDEGEGDLRIVEALAIATRDIRSGKLRNQQINELAGQHGKLMARWINTWPDISAEQLAEGLAMGSPPRSVAYLDRADTQPVPHETVGLRAELRVVE